MMSPRSVDHQLQKPEACEFGAGVGSELGLVNLIGNTNTTTKNTSTHQHSTTHHLHGSDLIGSSTHHHQLDLVAAVTTSFGVHCRKKRMARQRRSSTINIQLSFPSSSHVPPFPLQPSSTSTTLPPARVSNSSIFIFFCLLTLI